MKPIIKIAVYLFLFVFLLAPLSALGSINDKELPNPNNIKVIAFEFYEDKEIEAAEIKHYYRIKTIYEYQDSVIIKSLLKIIDTAVKNEDHKCADRFFLNMILSNGDMFEMGFLPGHTEQFYEVRINGENYKFERNLIINWFKEWGIPETLLYEKD